MTKRNRRPRRRHAGQRKIHTHRAGDRMLRLEPLEDRCMLAVVTVDTELDVVDFADGVTSLREAIFATNLVPGADEITFDFGHDGPATILLSQGELKITDDLIINGGNAVRLTIDAQQWSRIFNIWNSQSRPQSVTLAGMTLTGGDSGAIYSISDLTIRDSVLSGNKNTNFASGVITAYGGSLVVQNSVITDNHSYFLGGAIFTQVPTLITDSRIERNEAMQGGGIYARSPNLYLQANMSARQGLAVAGNALSNATDNLRIENSTITGNRAQEGGGVWIVAGNRTTLSNSIVQGNSATDGLGGGIGGEGDATIHDSIIRDNRSTQGGGIGLRRNLSALTDNSLVVKQSLITGNEADEGGGIYMRGIADISGSTIATNHARRRGGGLFLWGTLSMHATELHENTAGDLNLRNGLGGGFFLRGSDHRIESSTISNNTARQGGGGIVQGRVEFNNSTISGNVAVSSGGIRGDALVLRHSTVTGNQAVFAGGGSGSFGGITAGAVMLDHTIVAGNDDANHRAPDLFAPTQSVHHSIVGNNLGNALPEAPVGLPDAQGNLIGGAVHGVIDPLLGPLADNGGLSPTHALLAGSPAVNAGDLNSVTGTDGVPEFDQRGNRFGRIASGRIDLGAYERQEPGDLNLLVDTLVDESDGNYQRGDLSLREAIEWANSNPFADTIHFDPALAGGSILLTMGELAITNSVEIVGLGADRLTIDASGNDPTPSRDNRDGSRVFFIDDGNFEILSNVLISDITLTGGDVRGSGGAIDTRENLRLRNAVIMDNVAFDRGGGLAAYNPIGREQYGAIRVDILNGTIMDNISYGRSINQGGHGGGIYFISPVSDTDLAGLTIIDSSITQNRTGRLNRNGYVHAGTGGGITSAGTTTISGSTIENNLAGDGGGLSLSSLDHLLTITKSSVTHNIAGIRGGGIYWRSIGSDSKSIFSIVDSNISGNASLRRGGGGIYAGNILLLSSARLWIDASTISGNQSSTRGGGGLSSFVKTRITQSTISSNRITNNGRGGGLYLVADLSIEDSTISGNTANHGGGIYGRGKTVINHSVITNNSAINDDQNGGTGGGVHSYDTLITDSDICNNWADRSGGGAWLSEYATILRSNIHDNRSGNSGGGIFHTRETLIIEESTIYGNSANSQGGGVYTSSDKADILSSTISGNSADTAGGVWLAGETTIAHSTITNNLSDSNADGMGSGGGIFVSRGVIDLDHTIVAGNHDRSGLAPDIAGIVSSRFSLLGYGADFLGPLADNGGPTPTHALLAGSPAMDGGDPTMQIDIDGTPEFDQRSAPFGRIVGSRIDIGAMEAQSADGSLRGDFNNDTDVDGQDFLAWQRGFGTVSGANLADGDATGDGDVDDRDLAVWEATFGVDSSTVHSLAMDDAHPAPGLHIEKSPGQERSASVSTFANEEARALVHFLATEHRHESAQDPTELPIATEHFDTQSVRVSAPRSIFDQLSNIRLTAFPARHRLLSSLASEIDGPMILTDLNAIDDVFSQM